jgi:aryl-alcohol dehydrogenase-like predicted oxidoreductase
MIQIYFEDIKTSNLGFGTSLLTRSNSVKDAISNLETSFDYGITHFDCARLYGFGQAEEILGRFLRDKRKKITITTKSGLSSRELPLFALPLINKIRKFVSFNQTLTNATNNLVVNGQFTPVTIQKDLEKSLRKLKTEYIDFYLLHEAEVAQANSLDILNVLEKEKQKGKILHFGIASNTDKIASSYYSLNEAHKIVQHNSSLLGGEIKNLPINYGDRLRIIYNIFSQENREYAEQKFRELGFSNSFEYILDHFKSSNSGGITLFSSNNNKNIKSTAEFWYNSNN